MIDALYNFGAGLLPGSWWVAMAWPVLWILLKIVLVLAPLMGAVAYLTLWERKLLGFMQVRHGPNRVGPMGLLQPIADALKLLTKELINLWFVPFRSCDGNHASVGCLGRDPFWSRCRLDKRECWVDANHGHHFH